MPYDSLADAIAIARLGKGSLAGSLFTHDDAEAREVILGTAPWHGHDQGSEIKCDSSEAARQGRSKTRQAGAGQGSQLVRPERMRPFV